jgi:hypothetical protein
VVGGGGGFDGKGCRRAGPIRRVVGDGDVVVAEVLEGAEDGGHRHLFNGALASGVSDFF